MIHETAIIDPEAKIARGVTIGPYAVIGANVEIGEGSSIGPHAVVKGPTTIGRENRIFQFASVGEDPQDRKYAGEDTLLEVGDRNVFREHSTVHRGTVQDQGITRIGSDNLIMVGVHVAHDCVIGSHTIFSNNASVAGHVHVEDHVILGGFTLVHQFCHIGEHAFSAMGSVISRDVPPYVLVSGHMARPYGLNSEGLKRRGFDQEILSLIKKAYKLLYKSGLSLEEAISRIEQLAPEQPSLSRFADFLKNNTSRGIVR